MLGWSIGGFRKSAIAALLSTFNYHYYSAHCSSLLCSIARPCSAQLLVLALLIAWRIAMASMFLLLFVS